MTKLLYQSLNVYHNASGGLARILLFFFKLAWQARYRLPSLLTSLFMALDIRVRVEAQF